MKLELRSHYWPKTPELREIKLIIDGHEYYSKFMNRHDILNLAKQLRNSSIDIEEIANRMDIE